MRLIAAFKCVIDNGDFVGSVHDDGDGVYNVLVENYDEKHTD